MSTKRELKALFTKLLQLEKDAEQLYTNYLEKIEYSPLANDLKKIKNDETSHVILAKKALDILGEGEA